MKAPRWAPLALLDADASEVERALGSESIAEVEARLERLAQAPPDTPRRALGVRCARLALTLRGGAIVDGAPLDDLRRDLQRAGETLFADFILVEQAALLPARVGLARLADLSPEALEASPALAAAALRLEGSFARATGDLRASLALLQRSVHVARRAGELRELVRSQNTLGTSLASLGLTGPARAVLLPALELASVLGERQSIAIAEGQLAVLALDEGDGPRAVRALGRQAQIARELGDVHGQARALSLLVEAHGLRSNLDDAKTCADEARALHRREGLAWTARQAVFATLYEAEIAFAHGRHARGDQLLADARGAEEAPAGPLRARLALVALVRAAATNEALSADAIAAFASELRLSPRPSWVERALSIAAKLASDPRHRHALALRAAMLAEARAACGVPSTLLAATDESLALDRVMARARDLVGLARLTLAPLDAWEARLTYIEAKTQTDLDRLVGLVLGRAADTAATGHDLIVSSQGPLRVVFARASGGSLDEWVHDLGRQGAQVFSTTARMILTDEAAGSLALVPAPWHVPRHADAPRDPLPPSP